MLELTHPLLLASGSPRRKEIMTMVGFTFLVATKDTEEIFPNHLALEKVPSYLAHLKANAFTNEANTHIVVAADTVVILNNQILGKPTDAEEAKNMLQKLSGKSHQVVTGVCIAHQDTWHTLSETTLVSFKKLSVSEIDYYVSKFSPFDKAGSYGVQEWIGLIGIEKIEGSYFNVMGLPIHRVYEYLFDTYKR